ncbi:MAG: hypothetical protein ACQETI_04190 [Halobacteriota archaeon]
MALGVVGSALVHRGVFGYSIAVTSLLIAVLAMAGVLLGAAWVPVP